MLDVKIILYVLLGFLINIITILLASLRYKYILGCAKEKISLLHSAYLFCIAQVVVYFDPSRIGSSVVKSLASNKLYKTSVRGPFLVTIFEQAFDYLWQIPFLFIVIFMVGKNFLPSIPYLQIIILFFIMTLIMLIILKFNKFFNLIFKKVIPKKILNLSFFKKEDFSDVRKELLDYFKKPKFLIFVSLLTLLVVLFAPFLITLSLLPFGVVLSYQQTFFIYWIAFIVGRLSGIPGGFGSRDVTLLGMLVYFGIASGVALKAILLYRMITLIPSLFVGGSLLLYYGGKYGFKIFSKEES